MGFGRPRRAARQKSLREHLQDSQRGLNYYADMTGKPRLDLAVPEKRQYTKRTDGSSEHAEQCAVIQWWDSACGTYNLPRFALFAVPNGAHLASGYIGAGKLKREGMRSGALDLILAKPTAKFAGCMIEMKYGDNKPSDAQNAFIGYLSGAGYYTTVCYSADAAIDAIKEYLSE